MLNFERAKVVNKSVLSVFFLWACRHSLLTNLRYAVGLSALTSPLSRTQSISTFYVASVTTPFGGS